MAERTKPSSNRRRSMSEPPDIRLVLVGKTGAGKSSSGNTILGKEAFTASVSQSSVTRQCCKLDGDVFGREVTIIDTPGFFDTSLSDDTVKREISKCINMSAPGPHGILLVIKVGRFTTEEEVAVKKVEEIFGEDAWRYTMILFTHDHTEADIQERLHKAGPALQSVLKKVENRFHILNNNKTNDRSQVLDLLEKVETMVAANGGECYSNYTYQEVMEMLEERESKLRVFYEKKLEEETRAVEVKYERRLKEAQQDKQQMEERLQRELMELRRYYHALESGVRRTVERIPRDACFEEILKTFPETLRLN